MRDVRNVDTTQQPRQIQTSRLAHVWKSGETLGISNKDARSVQGYRGFILCGKVMG